MSRRKDGKRHREPPTEVKGEKARLRVKILGFLTRTGKRVSSIAFNRRWGQGVVFSNRNERAFY